MIPDHFLDNDVLLDAMTADEGGLLGPSKTFSSGLCEEDDDLRIIPLGHTCVVLIVDVSDEVISMLTDYDPVTHEFESCACFDTQRPAALPIGTDILDNIKIWIEGVTETRMNFYSAQEDPDPVPTANPKKVRSPIKPSWSSWLLCRLRWRLFKPIRRYSRKGRLRLPLLLPLPSLPCRLLQRCWGLLGEVRDRWRWWPCRGGGRSYAESSQPTVPGPDSFGILPKETLWPSFNPEPLQQGEAWVREASQGAKGCSRILPIVRALTSCRFSNNCSGECTRVCRCRSQKRSWLDMVLLWPHIWKNRVATAIPRTMLFACGLLHMRWIRRWQATPVAPRSFLHC